MVLVLREEPAVASAAPLDVPRLRWSDLRERPLVMFRPGYDLRETTPAAGRVRAAVRGGGREVDAVPRFAEGAGVAIVPSTVPAARSLHATPLSPTTARTVALAHRTDVAPTSAARAFRAELRTFLRAAPLPRAFT